MVQAEATFAPGLFGSLVASTDSLRRSEADRAATAPAVAPPFSDFHPLDPPTASTRRAMGNLARVFVLSADFQLSLLRLHRAIPASRGAQRKRPRIGNARALGEFRIRGVSDAGFDRRARKRRDSRPAGRELSSMVGDAQTHPCAARHRPAAQSIAQRQSSNAVHRRSGAQRIGLLGRTAFHAIRTRASMRGATRKPATRAFSFEQA